MDIFLVDEALALGDMEYWRKCLHRFREFKKDGKTVVLVSHNLDIFTGFCEKTLRVPYGLTSAFGAIEVATYVHLEEIEFSQSAEQNGESRRPWELI